MLNNLVDESDHYLDLDLFSTVLDMLNNLVDESDPDLDLPNIVHAFQTAERIRYQAIYILISE
jgi:Fe-S cluster assembly ATPase SufC